IPPPITTTRPGATPGTPPSSSPRPPSGFSRKYAPACAARRPAISLIGASSGRAPESVSTVSYATAAMPLSTSACVSGASAAMWRYVKRTRPSRSRPYSASIGSFTLRSSSLDSQTSSTETIRAPPLSYALSRNELPSPAPVSTRTSWPRWMSSRAPAGVRATRYSSDLISLATPIFMRANPTSRVDTEAGRRREERCCERPVAAGEPRLLFELALRGRERLFIGLARAGREFEQVPARGLTQLADERRVPVGLDGEDRDRAGMVDDLALVLPPALHVDADQPAVEDPPLLVWPQPALLHQAGEPAGEPAGGERGLEEPRVVIRTAAHVRERQPGTRPAPAGRVDLDRAREPRGRVDAGGPPGLDVAQAELDDGTRVVGDAAVPVAFVAAGDPHRENGGPAERRRRVRSVRRGEAAVAEPRRRADDPGADRADDRVERLRRGPRQRGSEGHAFDIPAETRPDRDGHRQQLALSQRAHRVGERERKRAAGELHVGNPRAGKTRADRRQLAVERAADHRQTAQLVREGCAFLGVMRRVLQRRVRQLHHMGPGRRRETEPARQVRVEDIEAAGSEGEVAGLDVDDHLVAEDDRARQLGIGDTGLALHLTANETFVPLGDRGHRPTAEAKRHRARSPRGRR